MKNKKLKSDFYGDFIECIIRKIDDHLIENKKYYCDSDYVENFLNDVITSIENTIHETNIIINGI